MPTYEYRCPEGHAFERFQRISEDPVADCPECGAAAERVISGGAGFLLKGEGFYITDYRSEEYKKKASAEKEKSPGSAGSGGSKQSSGSEAGASGTSSGSDAGSSGASGGDSSSSGPSSSASDT